MDQSFSSGFLEGRTSLCYQFDLLNRFLGSPSQLQRKEWECLTKNGQSPNQNLIPRIVKDGEIAGINSSDANFNI